MRQLVSNLSFNSDVELKVLNEIWALDHIFTNHLLSQITLLSKYRVGAKLTKRYDRAQSPAQRLAPHPAPTEETRGLLDETLSTIQSKQIEERIEELLIQLERLSIFTPRTKPGPRVNRASNSGHHPEILDEASNQASWRSWREALREVGVFHTCLRSPRRGGQRRGLAPCQPGAVLIVGGSAPPRPATGRRGVHLGRF